MNAGLCETCRHVKKLGNARGSTFYMCQRAETDPKFPRYPRLPVMSCKGHELSSQPPPADNKTTSSAT